MNSQCKWLRDSSLSTFWLQISVALERLYNRAAPFTALATLVRQLLQRAPRCPERGNFLVDFTNARESKRTRSITFVGCVKCKQFSDLVKGEPTGLRGANEAQASERSLIVAPYPLIASGRVDQTPALIKADRLDTDPACL